MRSAATAGSTSTRRRPTACSACSSAAVGARAAQLRRHPALRADRDRGRRRALRGGAAARSGARRDRARTWTRRRALLGREDRPQLERAALGALAERSFRVAEAAQPAEGLTLSLCMIVKDEEELLPACLAAARDAVDEIVVVDTGSSDRTVEIAESFGATRRVVPVERLVRGCAQRLARARDRRLAHVPRRRRAARARGPAADPRAARQHLARGLLPDRDEPHGRRRVRHGGRQPCDAHLPQPPRVPLRGPHPRAEVAPHADLPARALRDDDHRDRALRLPQEPRRRQGQVAPQHRAARSARPRSRRARSPRSTSAPSTRCWATGSAPPSTSTRPGASCTARASGTPPGFAPMLAARAARAHRECGRIARGARRARRGRGADARLHRPLLRARALRAGRRRERRGGAAAAPLPRARRRAARATRPRWAPARTSPSACSPSWPRRAATTPRRSRSTGAASSCSPPSRRPCCRSRSCC